MTSPMRSWLMVSLLLSGGLFLASNHLINSGRIPEYERPALFIAMGEAIVLALFAAVMGITARRIGKKPSRTERQPNIDLHQKHPHATLFLISFIALFVELMLIRYCNAQIRIFSFYKNVPLIASFLGLGLGCCLARGSWQHVQRFLLWFVLLSVLLSAGSSVMSNELGKFAAIGSSEHILGDFIPKASHASLRIFSQAVIALFCLATFVAITLLFSLLGRLLGEAFERVSRLPGYTVNIVGSLVGILVFVGLSLLQTPPWVWFAVGLLPLLWWAPDRRQALIAVLLMFACGASVFPSHGNTIWSRYQKLVGHTIPQPGGTGKDGEAYLVEISDVFYQVAVDRRAETLEKTGNNPLSHYDELYVKIQRPESVLVVGAGTGNDVAAALRAGASSVTAVDIDPAIIQMGRDHHPEKPYDDPRVKIIVDDARHTFRRMPPASFDVVVFGLLDSHTQLGMSSVRLDNYVFTLESLESSERLVRPGGHIAITAATFQPWFQDRFKRMLEATINGPVKTYRNGAWVTYLGQVRSEHETKPLNISDAALGDLPSDNWPFIYLPTRSIPTAYLLAVGFLMIASVVVLKLGGLPFGRFSSYHGHLFLLGTAFLLMEVYAINRLALLFGTTWVVSAATIALVLFLIVCANLTVILFQRIPYSISYGALAFSLVVSYLIRPELILGKGTLVALGFGLVLLSPVYFAGLVFARSFGVSELAAQAMGANILGSVLGGWVEYSTMALGVRGLVLLAGTFYLGSFFFLILSQRRVASGKP